MENGSDQAIDRLIVGVREGSRTAMRRVSVTLLDMWQSHDPRLDALLDKIVEEAVAGSEAGVELALTAVHQLGLARPAITRLIIDPAVVDEVAQATLVKVEQNLAQFEQRSKFRTWVHSIARNEALMRLRKDRGEADASDQLETVGSHGGRMSSMIATRATIRQALEALPEPYRETMLLRADEQLEYQEIADVLQVPVGTVRSRLAAARDLLATELS